MKNTISAILLCLCVITAAQNKQGLFVQSEISASNTLYVGLDNPVKLYVKGIKPENLILSAQGKAGLMIARARDSVYNFRVLMPDTATVLVSYKKGGKTVKAGEYKFRCVRVPNPACYAGKTRLANSVNRSTLLAADSLTVKTGADLDASHKFTVLSFTLNVKGKNYYSSSYAFTNEMKQALKSAGVKTAGLSDVRVKGSDGVQSILLPVNFSIEN